MTSGELGMTRAPGWFRVSKDGDYPRAGQWNEDVWIGVGSYDLRVQGKVISGYKCSKVFLTDYYVFETDDPPAGALPSATQLNSKDVAKLHKVGLAKNFYIFGETSSSCYIAPTESRIRCPQYSHLA